MQLPPSADQSRPWQTHGYESDASKADFRFREDTNCCHVRDCTCLNNQNCSLVINNWQPTCFYFPQQCQLRAADKLFSRNLWHSRLLAPCMHLEAIGVDGCHRRMFITLKSLSKSLPFSKIAEELNMSLTTTRVYFLTAQRKTWTWRS